MTPNTSIPDVQSAGTLKPIPPATEDEALSLLKSAALTCEEIECVSKNPVVNRSRKVRVAICTHPHTPRYISIPLVCHLFTFDLMRVALTPEVPADVKRAAEGSLINRLETLPEGEKLSLAKRASGRVAAELLLDRE